MNLSPAYLRWREDTLSEGRAEGRAEGQETERYQEVEELLTAKFGELDAELRSLKLFLSQGISTTRSH